MYEIKSNGGSIKDIDIKNGIITGYFASFDNVDSVGDFFTKGAFNKTLKENSKRIYHLLQHDPSKPLGVPNVLSEDTKGLYFETHLSKEQLEVSYIKDSLMLYASGVFKEHSVGFRTIKADNENKGRNIKEVQLWEGSTVTWGANENTPFMGFKSKDDVNEIEKKLKSILKISQLSDETYYLAEIALKQLVSMVEPKQHSPEPSKNTQEAELKQFINLIKI